MKKDLIGFWGYPDPQIIEQYKKLYPEAKWVDLDLDFNYPDTKILPNAYCKIIKNILNNAIHLKSRLIVILAAIGKEKCDSGWFASEILKDFGLEIYATIFEHKKYKIEPKISTSSLPLRQKVELITQSIIEPVQMELKKSVPGFGFWGVPPNDLSILELFPDNTHVYGWIRCVDSKTPADLELEMFVEENVPTVFYAQSFCAKAQLAKYLADKYEGIYLDIHDLATNSVRAKLEAFLRLR